MSVPRLKANVFPMISVCIAVAAVVMASSPGGSSPGEQQRAAISPRFVPFQGRLADQGGTPVADGQYDLTFTLYADPDTIIPLNGWRETHVAFSVADGRFSVLLGSVTSLDNPDGDDLTNDAISFAQPVYLGVKVGSDAEMRPRKQIIPAVHAYVATNADHASSADYATQALNGWIPGEIKIWPGHMNRIPSGWMLCDGNILAVAAYPSLFAAIGTAWGCGSDVGACDGLSPDFHLPDLRGRFLRGVDDPTAVDPARLDPDASTRKDRHGRTVGGLVGSVQDHDSGSHNHGISDPGHTHAVNTNDSEGTGPATLEEAWPHVWVENSTAIHTSTTGISVLSHGGSETRPVNAYVNWIIFTGYSPGG